MKEFQFSQKYILLIVAVLMLPLSLGAQVLGSITGIVQDSTGAVVPGVTVVVKNTETGISTARQTQETGLYLFRQLQPGALKALIKTATPARRTYMSWPQKRGLRPS